MHRWMKCPGSVRLTKDLPEKSSKYADEGTAAHEVAAKCLQNGVIALSDEVGSEMADAVNMYVTEIEKHLTSPCEVYIEQKFNMESLHPGLFGTADCVLYDKKTKCLKVFDFKYGAGVGVEVVNNVQLMYYALGAMYVVGEDKVDQILMTVIQPRFSHNDGPVRSWGIPLAHLQIFRDKLKEYAVATESSNAPLNSGEHCKFCRASSHCPALHAEANAVAAKSFPDAPTLSARELSRYLEVIPKLEAFIKGIREFAYAEACQGRAPQGFKLVEKRAMRRWRDEEEVKKELNTLGFSDEVLFEKSLRSPAQMEKIVGKKSVAPLVVSESSGTTLVIESDKRAAVSGVSIENFPTLDDE